MNKKVLENLQEFKKRKHEPIYCKICNERLSHENCEEYHCDMNEYAELIDKTYHWDKWTKNYCNSCNPEYKKYHNEKVESSFQSYE